MEQLEIERQKKLGNNNPLLKTVEQLSTPKFSDGVMIKNKRKVQLNTNQNESKLNPIKDIQDICPSDVNQTRTRNGPMLSFERNNLRRELREKISILTNKRSK